MCGIAVLRAVAGGREVADMLSLLRHRGPDETEVYRTTSGDAYVGHTRLAIIDPAGGHQPLVGGDGAVAVSNGEIYNHEQLRRHLPPDRLVNGSDAAVLLPLFDEYGPRLAERLDGMFAFVVLDDDTTIAGRDRLGIKPLYRADGERGVAYASELKALMGRSWDRVTTVAPGEIWVDDRPTPYYRLPAPQVGGRVDEVAVAHWVERLRKTLDDAVAKRLMSDVPLGTFLSGGLDSSIITALAARHQPGLATFSLGFEGSADLRAARLVADHLGTDHHEIVVPEDEPSAVLPEVLYHLESWDRDLVRSALPTYLVARFAATELTVVLTGEGADELFAGYRYHGSYAGSPDVLQRELHRSVGVMHHSNLQRVDRMTMAHSLEARVPFLDPAVVEVAMAIPAELKLRPDRHGRLIEKWILRRAFEDILPPEIVWRTKSQFDEGSGAADRLPVLAEAALGHGRLEPVDVELRDLEERWYFDQLRADLGDWRMIEANTTPWDRGRLPVSAAS
jgi:asparagine synthase (glutamine-hydrolysing)